MKTKNKMFRYYIPESICLDEEALEIYQKAMDESEKYYIQLWEYLYAKFRNVTDSVAMAAVQAQTIAEQILPIAVREVDRKE